MPDANAVVDGIATAADWDTRVRLIRRIPELFGTAEHAGLYAAVARRVYVPKLTPEFAYVHWRDEYELSAVEAAYTLARDGTRGFQDVSRDTLTRVIEKDPTSLRIFRLLLGLTGAEFAEACKMVADEHGLHNVTKGAVQSAEEGGRIRPATAATCATTIDLAMTGVLFPTEKATGYVRRKTDKPDTASGWETVRGYAASGVPLPVFLHQRLYGGAFRQLLDATSSRRGDLLENPVGDLLTGAAVPHIRTGSHDQAAVASRFGLTVRPAPDFVIFDNRSGTLRAILECKGANDGGTARDKAARFRSLRVEAQRLGGIPVFAVLGGVGWRRTADALGPVIRDTDGRVFTLATLADMLQTEPFPSLQGLARQSDETNLTP